MNADTPTAEMVSELRDAVRRSRRDNFIEGTDRTLVIADRLERLEAENAELRAEVERLKCGVKDLSLLVRRAHKFTPEVAGRHAVRIASEAGVTFNVCREEAADEQ